MPPTIVPQSAGSFSVAVLALIMAILQLSLLIRKSQFKWFGWGAAISFSGMIYAIGVFVEYNAPAGPVNRFAGVLEFAAIICLIHSVYGFTFAYLGLDGKRYHFWAGLFHVFVLTMLWSGTSIVADRFVSRSMMGLASPFVESDLGPLGFLFELYGILASLGVILLWVNHKSPDLRHRRIFIAGMAIWLLLAGHDGLASMGFPVFQYGMEYGFLGFSLIVLWVVFTGFIDITAVDKYQVITEYAHDGILMLQDDKTIFGNPAACAMAGHPVTNFSLKELMEYMAPEDCEHALDHYHRLLDGNKYSDLLTVRLRKSDGEERIMEIDGSLIEYRSRPAVLAILRDITERIRKEEALRESNEKLARLRKMESLGLLAGGVAHDLNNVLAGIVGYPELILLDLPKDSKLRKPIETMQESGLRAVAIVDDLLTVARGAAHAKESLSLNRIIQEYLASPEYRKLLQYHPGVDVKQFLNDKLLNVKGSPIHIRKLVMNLISNASEAIEGCGTIAISTENRYLDRSLKGYEDVIVGEYAVLTVEDTGAGIPAEDLKRIFEPFFTKKVMGRSGTGLGLTLVWNVIQDHNGYVNVTSNPSGTKFELYFPITRESISERKAATPLEDLRGRGETILIIDDVQSQRDICSRMLEILHYKVTAVSSGEAAVEYLKENRTDLLILDMIMDPGINGRETYKRIKQIHPHQKAIIVSGFAETDQVMETLQLGAGRFIKKPLILEELGLSIKQELTAS